MPRFTGGDHLKPEDGLKYYIHQTMMLNELSGGHGAYKMSNAVNAASGPSFGPIQYDIGGNSRGRTLLEQVAREAKNTQGQRIVSDNEIRQMQQHFYKPFTKMSVADKQIYQELRPKLDQSLKSSGGIRLVNEDYDKVLDKKVDEVNTVIAKITNLHNKTFLENSMQAQVFIADIKNQYSKKVNNALAQFLNQTEHDQGVKLPGKGGVAKVHGELDMEDLKHFRMQTAYGISHPKDARRRDENIEQVTAPAKQVSEINRPQSKYDEVRAMLDGLLNDTNGSYARKVLEEHADKVAHFDEKVRQSIEQDKQRDLASKENQSIQHEEQQQGFSRSFG